MGCFMVHRYLLFIIILPKISCGFSLTHSLQVYVCAGLWKILDEQRNSTTTKNGQHKSGIVMVEVA